MKKLLHIWRLLNLPCRDMTALLSRAEDGQLSRAERFAARLHLLYCKACRRFLRQVRQLGEAARTAARRVSEGADAAGPRLSPAARERIARRLGETP